MQIEELLIIFGVVCIVNGVLSMWRNSTLKETVERFAISGGAISVFFGIIYLI